MAEETQSASSTEVEDVFQGKQVSMDEFSRYRQDGELPARFKPAAAESAPDDTLEETEKTEGENLEPATDSEPEDKQELPPKATPAEKRIKQLLAEKKELERKLEEKTGVKTEPAPVEAKAAFPKPTAEDKNPDGTPKYKEYEDVIEAISRWAAKEERTKWEREQREQDGKKALQVKLDDARERYDDADDVIFPANQAIQTAQIPLVVKEVFAQSDLFVDLCYVVGSDPEELKKFLTLARTNPRAAIGKVFEYERGIREELAKNTDGGETPVPKKTSAPKPPVPVGGGSSRAFDVSDESLSPNDWMRKRNAALQKKRQN